MDNPDYINFPGEQRLLSVKKAKKSKSSKSVPTVPAPPSPQVTPFTDSGGNFTLQQAVDAFIIEREDWDGGEIYGQDIKDWDVSQVTSFFALFFGASDFNDDIGDWDVSSGTRF
eukprot:scaffold50988_cov49-Attheya_sp.AAC.1